MEKAEYCLFYVQTMCMPSSDWASWAQAGASGLAIVIGAVAIWWQVRRQHIEEKRQQVADEVRRLEIIASGMFHCRVLAQSLVRSYRRGWASGTADVQLILRHTQQLAAISPLDVPDWRASFAIARASHAASSLAVELGAEPQHPRDAEPHANVAVITFEVLEGILRDTLRDRGSDIPAQTVRIDDIEYRSLSAKGQEALEDTGKP